MNSDSATEAVDVEQLCEVRAQSVALVFEEPDGSEEIEVAEEGYMCPNDAVGRYELKTHAGPTMEFWMCKEHAEKFREEDALVE